MVSAADYLRKVLLSPVYEAARVTPLQTLKKLSERLGNHVSLKREDLQPVHSFKLRGAYHKIATLTQEQKERGVIAASAGNHAQGVALSAAKLGIKAIIVMPKTTPDIKIDAVRRQGGNVMLFGNSFDEAYGESRRLAELEGYTLIPPFDDVEVIAGQGTIGKELLEQDTHLTHVFVPVGGGGLAAGVAVYIKQLLPDVKVIGVEAEGSACLKAALAAGEPVNLERVSLFADGVAVKRIGEETFRLCNQYLDEVVTVSNDQICAALKDIFDDCRAIAEPSGALSLAGLSIEIAHLGTPCPNRFSTLTSLRHLVVVLHHIADTRHPHPDSLVVGLGVSQQAQFVDSVRHLVLMNVSHGEMVVDLQVVPQLQGVGKAGDGVVNLSYLQGSYTVILQGVKLARLGLLLLLFGTFLCRPEYAL